MLDGSFAPENWSDLKFYMHCEKCNTEIDSIKYQRYEKSEAESFRDSVQNMTFALMSTQKLYPAKSPGEIVKEASMFVKDMNKELNDI